MNGGQVQEPKLTTIGQSVSHIKTYNFFFLEKRSIYFAELPFLAGSKISGMSSRLTAGAASSFPTR